MPRRFLSLLYLCAALGAAAFQGPAMASHARGPRVTAKVIVAPRFICYPVLIPLCDYFHPPPVIYNTPCGVWLPDW